MAMNFEVKPSNQDRVWCPITVRVDAGLVDTAKSWEVVDKYQLTYPVQAAAAGDQVELTWMLPYLAAGAGAQFNLREVTPNKAAADGAPTGVVLQEVPGSSVDILVNGQAFTTYNYAASWARPFLYPVIGPGGASLTRRFPMCTDVPGERPDHPHHKSIWIAHGDVNGVDNWSEMPGHGKTVHQGFRQLTGGPVYGQLHSDNQWVSNTGVAVVDQQTILRIYATPDHLRIIDVAVAFTATYSDVTFGDTKEGGLISVRVAGTMDGKNSGVITQSTGATGENQTWGKRASWCHYHGTVQANAGPLAAGIGIVDHPANPRFPTYWHVRDYGLMTANPFGLSHFYNDKSRNGALQLPKGDTAVFRYRLVLHAETNPGAGMNNHFLNFAFPPLVTVS